LTRGGIIGDKLSMKDNQKKSNKITNITEAQGKIIAEREKRLGAALRENLKRRKMSGKVDPETPK